MTVLIAIEGIDGAGKGTQATRLVERLKSEGLSAFGMQFPRYSETTFGTAIGDFLNGKFGSLDQVHPQLAAVLYAGDRFESTAVLKQAMDEHDVVVLDRFTGSNLAHQCARLEGAARTQLQLWIDRIEHEIFGLPRPDLNVLVDISSTWSRELVSRKGERDYTDAEADIQESNLPYLEKVRACYLEIARSRDDWQIVPCLNDAGELRTIESINQSIYERMAGLLNPSAASQETS